MIDQAAYAAACDERSYGEPTCEHSDEQNMGGECEACYVKRTASPAAMAVPALKLQGFREVRSAAGWMLLDEWRPYGKPPDEVRCRFEVRDYLGTPHLFEEPRSHEISPSITGVWEIR